MNLKKLPQDIRTKVRANLNKINSCNSKELFEYSKTLNAIKDDLGLEVSEYLFKAIDDRTAMINSGLEKKREYENQKMIKKFIKGMK